jgi:ubiquinone/menaquinone biosynthesis C-methylase UbiE
MRRAFARAVLALPLAAALLAHVALAEDRRPAPVMSYRGAAWLEREGRDEEQRPDEIIRAMKLKDGDVVADFGCGSGYFTRRLARAVGPRGRVYAVDVQPEMLALVTRRVEKEGLKNVVTVLATTEDPRLDRNLLDWVLMVDVYHELQQPKATLARLRDALKPEGRVALVEYRLEGTTALHIREEHRMSPKQVLEEWQPAGFRLAERQEFLPTQHFLVMEKAKER